METGVDYSVKKLHDKVIFKLFLFAFLNSGGLSLRILEAIFKSERFRNLLNLPTKSIKHSAIGMRLKNIDSDYFENIFKFLIASPQLKSVLFDRRKTQVSKIDTTIVTLSSKLLKFGLNDNPGIKTLKFGVGITGWYPGEYHLFQGSKVFSRR